MANSAWEGLVSSHLTGIRISFALASRLSFIAAVSSLINLRILTS
jgi:hypothetical protein